MLRRLAALVVVSAAAVAMLVLSGGAAAGGPSDANKLRTVDHIVVIYEENHSFDNLYGGWEGVNGLGSVDISRTTQVNQAGQPYGCLLQDDVNLTSPAPLSTTCTDSSGSPAWTFQSAGTLGGSQPTCDVCAWRQEYVCPP